MKEQEYYYNAGYVTIWGEVEGKPEYVIVNEGGEYGELSVARKSQLIPKEESYMFKEAKKRADEIRAVTAKAEEHFDEVVEKVIERATSALSMRMKLNTILSKDTSGSGWAILIANELEKLVKEKAPEVIKENSK